MGDFKVGEVVTIVLERFSPGYAGTDVLIVGPWTLYFDFHRHILDHGYEIQTHDGEIWRAWPSQLRRKLPADDGRQVTRWVNCPWQPTKETCQ